MERMRFFARGALKRGASPLSAAAMAMAYTARHREWLAADAVRARLRHEIGEAFGKWDVILAPIASRFGVAGLLIATVMAGVLLLALGLGRAGRFIEFVPYPVTTGFTAGIAVVIGTLQIKDFLGLIKIKIVLA